MTPLPDERMVEAAILVPRSQGGEDLARHTLKAAFAALDRDALIEAGAAALITTEPARMCVGDVLHDHDWTPSEAAEAVLRAVGLIA